MTFIFGKESKLARAKLMPCMQKVADAALAEGVIDFRILDASRGRLAQEKAKALGHSTVGFGNSAHNWVPALAMDLFPAPYSWENRQAFITLAKVVLAMPAKHNILGPDGKQIRLRWGGDWNGDGNLSDGWDMPHYELHPWRDYRKYTKLYEG